MKGIEKMSKTIRVQWEYPDFANQLGDENYEYFEVDDDATPEEIQNEAEDIAFEHFSWSFWDVTKEHEKATRWRKQSDEDEAERE